MREEIAKKILKLVKDNYEAIAVDFDLSRKKPLWPILLEMADLVKPGQKVLDAACGNGRLVSAFPNKEIEYWGIDNSSSLLALAEKNYPGKKFLFDDLLSLETVPNSYFDWIFCIAALHHLPGKERRIRVLSNLKGKLKGDGQLVLSVWRLHEKKHRRARRWTMIKKFFFGSELDYGDQIFDWQGHNTSVASKRYYHCFTERSLKKIIKVAGWKIESFHRDKYNYFLRLSKDS